MKPIHFHLLLNLRNADKYGRTVEILLPLIRTSGFRSLTLPELELGLRDLADKSFVGFHTSPMGSQMWSITGLGLKALSEEGA